MRSERLLDALGEIDDNLMLSVLPAPVRRKKHPWAGLLAAAAMAALCIFGASQLQRTPPVIEENPPQTELPVEAPETGQELPILPMINFKSGRASVSTYSLDPVHTVMLDGKQLQEVPEALPVYKNLFPVDVQGNPVGWEPDYAQMEQKLHEIADLLQMTDPVEAGPHNLFIINQFHRVSIEQDQTLEIYYVPSFEFPIGTGIQTKEEQTKLAEHVLRKYEKELPFKDPACSFWGFQLDQEKLLSLMINYYTPQKDVPIFMNSGILDAVIFHFHEDGISEVEVRQSHLGARIGEYPILTPEEAASRLYEGYGMTGYSVLPEMPEIKQQQLIYLAPSELEYIMPYYLFLISATAEDQTPYYAAILLPAVRPDYLENSPRWDSDANGNANTPKAAIAALPDVDGVGEQAKAAFSDWFERHPELWMIHKRGDLELTTTQDGSAAVLNCFGPLEDGVQQVREYQYSDKTGQVMPGQTLEYDFNQIITDLIAEPEKQDAALNRVLKNHPEQMKYWLEQCFFQGELKNCEFRDGSLGAAKYELWHTLLPEQMRGPLQALTPEWSWIKWLEQTAPKEMMTYFMSFFRTGCLQGHDWDDHSNATEQFRYWRSRLDDDFKINGPATPQEYWVHWCREAETIFQTQGYSYMMENQMTVMALYIQMLSQP